MDQKKIKLCRVYPIYQKLKGHKQKNGIKEEKIYLQKTFWKLKKIIQT